MIPFPLHPLLQLLQLLQLHLLDPEVNFEIVSFDECIVVFDLAVSRSLCAASATANFSVAEPRPSVGGSRLLWHAFRGHSRR